MYLSVAVARERAGARALGGLGAGGKLDKALVALDERLGDGRAARKVVRDVALDVLRELRAAAESQVPMFPGSQVPDTTMG